MAANCDSCSDPEDGCRAEVRERARANSACDPMMAGPSRHDLVLRGMLRKQFLWGHWKQWKNFYYTINNASLIEFKGEKDVRPQRIIPLQYCSVYRADSIVNKSCVIAVAMAGRDPFFLQAKSDESVKEWLREMQRCSKMVEPCENADLLRTPTIIVNEQGAITQFNESASRMLGYTQEEIVGKEIGVVFYKAINYASAYDYLSAEKDRFTKCRHRNNFSIPIVMTVEQFVLKRHQYFMVMCRDKRPRSSCRKSSSPTREIESLEKACSLFEEKYRESEQQRLEAENRVKELQYALEEERSQVRVLECLLSGGRKGSITLSPGCPLAQQASSRMMRAPSDGMTESFGSTISDHGNDIHRLSFDDILLTEKVCDGRGVAANVFYCIVDGWSCAMKEFTVTEETRSSQRLKMFLKEIEVLEKIPHHPNILRYLHHTYDGKKIRLFTTRYSGTLLWKLEEMREIEQRFTAKEVADILLEILNGLTFLHAHNIVHRDLKSDNIFCMFSEHDDIRQVAIGDFDAARAMTNEDRGKTLVGTLGYTAPEVLMAKYGEKHGVEVDVWSLGMVIYELISLQRPYHDIETGEINRKILAGIPPVMCSDLGPEFDALVQIHRDCVQLAATKRPSLAAIKQELLRTYW